MPSLEAVCEKLFGNPGWVSKVALGGVLSFFPILNIFSLGYLLEYTIRLRRNKEWNLPDWKEYNLSSLFSHGIQALLILLSFAGLPILLGWLLSLLLKTITFGLIGVLCYLPLSLAAFIAPFLSLAAIQAFVNDGLFSDAWRIGIILRIAKILAPKLILPVIAFWGILILALPLYGVSFFLGSWILLAYSSAINFSKTN